MARNRCPAALCLFAEGGHLLLAKNQSCYFPRSIPFNLHSLGQLPPRMQTIIIGHKNPDMDSIGKPGLAPLGLRYGFSRGLRAPQTGHLCFRRPLSFPRRSRYATLRSMSTLAEIQSAADSPSNEEKEELLRFLAPGCAKNAPRSNRAFIPRKNCRQCWRKTKLTANVSARALNLFLDSSVAVAASLSSSGASRQVFDLAPRQGWRLQVSPLGLARSARESGQQTDRVAAGMGQASREGYNRGRRVDL